MDVTYVNIVVIINLIDCRLVFLFVLLLVLLASENELIPELSGRIIGGKSERSLECVGAGRHCPGGAAR